MNGIISLKKHVDVEHFVITQNFEEVVKMFLQMYQRLIIHTRIIYYNKIYICNIIQILLFNKYHESLFFIIINIT